MPLSAAEVLNREFLEIRCKILELAAALDRLDRAERPTADGALADDPRLARVRESLSVVEGESPGRAEQVQLIFSRPYDEAWRNTYKLNGS
jgi:hypothetical protein